MSPNDLIDKKILRLFEYVEYQEEFSFTNRKTYIEFNDKSLIELKGYFKDAEVLTWAMLERSTLDVIDGLPEVIDSTITRVLTCKYWPSFGLATSNGYFIFRSDYGLFEMGIHVSRFGERYQLSDVEDISDILPAESK